VVVRELERAARVEVGEERGRRRRRRQQEERGMVTATAGVVVLERLMWRLLGLRRPAENLRRPHSRTHAPHAAARLEHHAPTSFLATAPVSGSLLHHATRRATARPAPVQLHQLLILVVDEHADFLVVVVAVTTHRSI
jgi:hypothetical protein